MDVYVDQAGHQRSTGNVDFHRGRNAGTPVRDFGNGAALNHHIGRTAQTVGDAVKQKSVAKDRYA
jgi:hypothetical protein